jgi:CRISPR-associated endonuclease Cas2
MRGGVLAVVAYDISDDERREAVARILGAWLDRIQESVFMGRVAREQLGSLAGRVRTRMGRGDRLVAVGLCPGCARRALRMGWRARPSWALSGTTLPDRGAAGPCRARFEGVVPVRGGRPTGPSPFDRGACLG